jgi:hypothetical protein
MPYPVVSVPEEHYSDVIAYLASLMAGTEAAPQSEASPEPRDEGRNWSEATWELFWPNLTDAQQDWMQVQARNADAWVGIEEIERTVFDGNFNMLQGAQRSFSRRAVRHAQQSKWPFDVRHDPQTGRMCYRMNARQAEIVLRLALRRSEG